MPIDVRPATRFEDVATIVGPRKPDANVCWCLSYRVSSKENQALRGPARGERVAELLAEGPIGVLAYDGDDVVGWAAVAPRSETAFARSRVIPVVDDEQAGFSKGADTTSVINGFPRVLMRLDLTGTGFRAGVKAWLPCVPGGPASPV